jgi:hypothetical protein
MTVGTSFANTGYYLGGTSLPELADPNTGTNNRRILGWIVIGLALLLLFAFAVPVVRHKTKGEVRRPDPVRVRPTGRPARRGAGPGPAAGHPADGGADQPHIPRG